MENKIRITGPRYQQIAVDVAVKIANHQYKEGDKVFARSALASQYGVSAETARRAMCVLDDMQIVKSTKGSGFIVTSYENAVKFIQQQKDIDTVKDIKARIIEVLKRQEKDNKFLNEQINRLIDKTSRFNTINPFVPYEMEIKTGANHIGKNLSEINLWHNTSATIVGIRRGDSLILSPGPYAEIYKGDIIFFVGNDQCFENVKSFFYKK